MPKRKNDDAPYWRTLRKTETDMINYALEQASSVRKAAKLLGVSESFLIVRVQKLKCVRPASTQDQPKAKPRVKAADGTQKRAKKARKAPEPPPPDNVVQLNPGKNGNNAT